MNCLEGKNNKDNDDLVDERLIKHWKSLKKRPNIIGKFVLKIRNKSENLN